MEWGVAHGVGCEHMHMHMHMHIHIRMHMHMHMRGASTVVVQVWHCAAGRSRRELAVQRGPSRKARAAPRCVAEL